MKKLISLISIIAILLTSLMVFASCGGAKGPAATEWDTVGDIQWKFDKDDSGKATVLYIKSKDSNAPAKMKDYEKSADLPWKKYSAYATKVVLTDISVVSDKAFYNMTALTSIDFGDDIIEIGDLSFAFCTALTEVTIPNGVTKIGASAFEACPALKKVTLPHTLTDLGDKAFAYDYALEEAVFSKGFEKELSAEKKAAVFTSATDKLKLSFVDIKLPWTASGKIQWKIETTEKDGKKTVALIIQNGAGESAPAIDRFAADDKSAVDTKLIPWFNYREFITKIELSNISEISEKAFSQMTALTEVSLGKSLTKIEKSAFEGCTAIKTVTGEGTVEIPEGTFPEGVKLEAPQPEPEKPEKPAEPEKPATDDNKPSESGNATEDVKESDTAKDEPAQNNVIKIVAVVVFALVIIGLIVGGILLARSNKNQTKDARTVRKNDEDKSKNTKKGKKK